MDIREKTRGIAKYAPSCRRAAPVSAAYPRAHSLHRLAFSRRHLGGISGRYCSHARRLVPREFDLQLGDGALLSVVLRQMADGRYGTAGVRRRRTTTTHDPIRLPFGDHAAFCRHTTRIWAIGAPAWTGFALKSFPIFFLQFLGV